MLFLIYKWPVFSHHFQDSATLAWHSDGKESVCNIGDLHSTPRLGRSPGERHGTACLENPHGQRSLVGYSPWSNKESDITKRISTAQHEIQRCLLYLFNCSDSISQSLWLLLQSPMLIVTKLRLTLLQPMGCSPPGSSVHGIFQEQTMEWVAIFFSRGSSKPRDWTCIPDIGSEMLYHWSTREAPPKPTSPYTIK